MTLNGMGNNIIIHQMASECNNLLHVDCNCHRITHIDTNPDPMDVLIQIFLPFSTPEFILEILDLQSI